MTPTSEALPRTVAHPPKTQRKPNEHNDPQPVTEQVGPIGMALPTQIVPLSQSTTEQTGLQTESQHLRHNCTHTIALHKLTRLAIALQE